MAYDIFISYRREGGYETAKHLYDLLNRDGYKVSFDIDTLRNGDFDIELYKRIDECTDFILILNKGAFDRTVDPAFDSRKDWMRNELAYALEKGKNVIPVMLAGFDAFPDNLPDDVVRVQKKNGPKYDRYYFDDFYRKLKTVFLETPEPDNVADMPVRYLKLSADAACSVYVDGEFKAELAPGSVGRIPLPEGRYVVKAVSSENPEVEISFTETLADSDSVRELSLTPLMKSFRDADDTARLQAVAVRLLEEYGGPVIWPDSRMGDEHGCSYKERGFLIGRGGKYGVSDVEGHVVMDCEWDSVEYSCGVYIVSQGGKFGLIDRNGVKLTALEYDCLRSGRDDGLIPAKKGEKWGYIDSGGSVVLDFKYEDACPFIDGRGAVRLHGMWTTVDRRGVIASRSFDSIHDGRYWCSEGLMPVCIGGKWGFADNMGNIVIKAGYKWVETFYNGTAYASNDFSWWFIDRNGDRIKGNSRNLRELNWSGDACTFSSGGLHAACKGNRLGYVDNEYEIVIPFEYDFNKNAAGRRGRFSEGLLNISKNGRWGYIDNRNETVLDFIYDDASEFIDGIAYVKQDGRHGFIDRKGHLMSAPIPSVSAASGYEPLNDYERYILDDAEFVRYEENGYIGYKDASSGQIVIKADILPERPAGRFSFENYEAWGEECERRGLTFTSGPRTIARSQLAFVIANPNSFYKCYSRTGFVIDKLCNIIDEYEVLVEYRSQEGGDRCFAVRNNKAKSGKYDMIGVIDSHGSEIVPFWYASMVHFSGETGELVLRKKKYSFENKPDGIDVWSLKTGRRVSGLDCRLLPEMRRKNMLRLFWSLLVLAGLHVAMISPWSLFHLWTQMPSVLKIGYVAMSCVLFFILLGQMLKELSDNDGSDCRYDYYPALPLAAAYGLALLIMLPKLSVVLTILRILGYVVCAVLLIAYAVRLLSVSRTFRLTRKSSGVF